MRLVTIIAIGDKKFGQFALNCCLSIKAHDWKQKVALITDGYAIDGIVDEVNKFFDYRTTVSYSEYPTPQEKAFYTKVNLYEIATKICGEATEFIAIDADCIMIPSHGVKEWFDEHQGLAFTCWNNDVYDFKTNTTKRKDYTFWCNPLEAKEYYGLTNPMPQLNTSFMYFSKCPSASNLFSTAKKVWHDAHLKYTEYKGAKPDELCFNIACSINNILPHRTPYYPIFFQFASENQNELYIQHHYKSIGFAGQLRPSDAFVDLYNKYCDYYRDKFGVAPYKFDNSSKAVKDYAEIILDCEKRTIIRRGEAPLSDGGIFNPSSVYHNNRLITIFRKEKNLDCYQRYTHSTAIPHIILGDTMFDTSFANAEPARREDFRLFVFEHSLWASYSKIVGDKCSIAISRFDYTSKKFVDETSVGLPIKTTDMEKNWLFFEQAGMLYCIYSLSPYLLFVLEGKKWTRVDVKTPHLKWFHSGYICNSTHPTEVDKYLLLWFHTKENGVYFHGAMLLDKETKEILHYTKNSIRMKDYAEGLHNGLIYVSGCVYRKDTDTVRVLYGEADSHSAYSEFDRQTLINAIKNNHA